MKRNRGEVEKRELVKGEVRSKEKAKCGVTYLDPSTQKKIYKKIMNSTHSLYYLQNSRAAKATW